MFSQRHNNNYNGKEKKEGKEGFQKAKVFEEKETISLDKSAPDFRALLFWAVYREPVEW